MTRKISKPYSTWEHNYAIFSHLQVVEVCSVEVQFLYQISCEITNKILHRHKQNVYIPTHTITQKALMYIYIDLGGLFRQFE